MARRRQSRTSGRIRQLPPLSLGGGLEQHQLHGPPCTIRTGFAIRRLIIRVQYVGAGWGGRREVEK
eukprot:1175456-Prorocentrum_minimum.AAC.4